MILHVVGAMFDVALGSNEPSEQGYRRSLAAAAMVDCAIKDRRRWATGALSVPRYSQVATNQICEDRSLLRVFLARRTKVARIPVSTPKDVFKASGRGRLGPSGC